MKLYGGLVNIDDVFVFEIGDAVRYKLSESAWHERKGCDLVYKYPILLEYTNMAAPTIFTEVDGSHYDIIKVDNSLHQHVLHQRHHRRYMFNLFDVDQEVWYGYN